MRVLVDGRFKNDILPLLKDTGLELVEKSPDLIISYGGDGSLLAMERKFPGIPKFPIRENKTISLCPKHSHNKLIKDFLENKICKTEIIKLVSKQKSKTKTQLKGINDIFIHNINRYSAIRCKVWIDNEVYLNEVAVDCIGIATPHGSSGYFQSITQCVFTTGIGLAFSNSREHVNHIIIPDTTQIKFDIIRGPALLVADNDPNEIELVTGEEIIISRSSDKVTIYGLDDFMCPACRKLRHIKT